MRLTRLSRRWYLALFFGLSITTIVYWPGLYGGWLFDDYPNIVDNSGVQPQHFESAALIRAALSSPASEFKRPLASLSFALNYLAGGLDPFWMKLTNLIIHLLNGVLGFLLSRQLLNLLQPRFGDKHNRFVAALIMCGWMLLPINLTSVLYTVQRMESMANLFVMLGLIGYLAGRKRMLTAPPSLSHNQSSGWRWFAFATCSIGTMTIIGLLAKETAVLLPLYAFLTEWFIFGFKNGHQSTPMQVSHNQYDKRIIGLFTFFLCLPAIIGLTILVPDLLKPEAWATRDFTLGTRLLSEARAVADYVIWTVFPTPNALSFYHDDFAISTSLLSPWTTLTSIIFLVALLISALWLRKRRPLVALGIAFFFGCHLLTATILPLELVYEHRNYFASFGFMLAIIPLLTPPSNTTLTTQRTRHLLYLLLSILMFLWTAETSLTAIAWGEPLKLAQTLAVRGPNSPRAQYELGRTYIIYSRYDPLSPYTAMAYGPLESAAELPNSSILPEQALIFMNARMKLPIKDTWWTSMISKLETHPVTIQDESSLISLVQCSIDGGCALPSARMTEAFTAALTHSDPSARLLASYGNYAWNVLGNRVLGEEMTSKAVEAAPNEPAYRITMIRMLATQGRRDDAKHAMQRLRSMNIGGSLNSTLAELQSLPSLQ